MCVACRRYDTAIGRTTVFSAITAAYGRLQQLCFADNNGSVVRHQPLSNEMCRLGSFHCGFRSMFLCFEHRCLVMALSAFLGDIWLPWLTWL